MRTLNLQIKPLAIQLSLVLELRFKPLACPSRRRLRFHESGPFVLRARDESIRISDWRKCADDDIDAVDAACLDAEGGIGEEIAGQVCEGCVTVVQEIDEGEAVGQDLSLEVRDMYLR